MPFARVATPWSSRTNSVQSLTQRALPVRVMKPVFLFEFQSAVRNGVRNFLLDLHQVVRVNKLVEFRGLVQKFFDAVAESFNAFGDI